MGEARERRRRQRMSRPDTSGEPSAWAQGRRAIGRLAPAGSSVRAVLRVARQVARDGVPYGERLRTVWSGARELEPMEPAYRHWLREHRPPVESLIHQTDPAVAERIRTRVEFVVLPGAGDDVAATLDTLVAQTFWAGGPPSPVPLRPRRRPDHGHRRRCCGRPRPRGRRRRPARPGGAAGGGRPPSSPTWCSTWSPGPGTTPSPPCSIDDVVDRNGKLVDPRFKPT